MLKILFRFSVDLKKGIKPESGKNLKKVQTYKRLYERSVSDTGKSAPKTV